MQESELIEQLKRVHSNGPRPEWSRATRQRLALHMQKASIPSSSFEYIRQLFGGRAFAMQFALMLCLLIGGTATFAARGSTPRSPLYPLKLVLESMKGRLAFTSEQKVEYGLATAHERIQELTALSHSQHAASAGDEQALIARTVDRYTVAIGESARTVKELKNEGKVAEAHTAAKELDRTVQEYSVLLDTLDSASSSRPVLESAKAASAEAQKTAGEILQEESADTSASSTNTSSSDPSTSPASSTSTTPTASPVTPASPQPATVSGEAPPSVVPNVVE